MRQFNEWFSRYEKASPEFGDREMTRDAFVAGMLAAADMVEPCDSPTIALTIWMETLAESIRREVDPPR